MPSLPLLTLLLVGVVAPSMGARLHYLTDREVHQDDPYIVGGKTVDPVGKWPWQGSMLTLYWLHQCGCALVGLEWAVTAAHCTTTPSFLMVVMFGAHDIHTRFKGDPTSYGIKKKIRHADWSGDGSKGYPNDIALIRLSRPANIKSPFIGVVDLADADMDFVGADCYITGWGLKRAGNIFLPNNLQEAQTTAMNNTECDRRFTELIGPGLINDGHICVGGRGTESGCMGDSGGPLVCKVNTTWVLAGVTSWGMANCDMDDPSVYTRISHYRAWMTDNSNGDL